MKIGQILQDKQPKEYKRINKERKKKYKENLSERDIKELMGHSSYKRGPGGSIKQVR